MNPKRTPRRVRILPGCTPRMRRAIEALPKAVAFLRRLKVARKIQHGCAIGHLKWCALCDQMVTPTKFSEICPACRSPFDKPATIWRPRYAPSAPPTVQP